MSRSRSPARAVTDVLPSHPRSSSSSSSSSSSNSSSSCSSSGGTVLEERKPATEETIATTPDKETSNSMRVRVARMARAGGWPAGPGIVADLFDWPVYNAQKMLGGNMATTRAQNVAAFMKKKSGSTKHLQVLEQVHARFTRCSQRIMW